MRIRLSDALDLLGIDPNDPRDAYDFSIVLAVVARRNVDAAERAGRASPAAPEWPVTLDSRPPV
jgi:hypothetical protein